MTKKAPDLATASERELLVYLIREIVPIVTHIGENMADLTQSLDDLTVAVDAIGVRFAEVVTPLQTALADAQAALEAAALEDTVQNQAIADALASAQAAADVVESQVDELNQIGTPPATP